MIMEKIIMVVGHPYWKNSVANRAIVDEFVKLHPETEVRNLAELYPDGNIDVEAEQKKLLAADIIVLQFPIMWYSCPSLMHKWMEEVLAYGFAYGQGGDKLTGKRFVVSFTSAASADMYSRYGVQGMTVDDMMPPFAGIPNHCHMQWGGYAYSGGMMSNADNAGYIRSKAKEHAQRLFRLINHLADE